MLTANCGGEWRAASGLGKGTANRQPHGELGFLAGWVGFLANSAAFDF